MCITNSGLEALTTKEELAEVVAVGTAPKRSVVKLRRTYNQSDFQGGFIRYWRVVAPATHRNYESDLSYQGLVEWGII